MRHLPILDRPVYLRLRPKRFICVDCDHHPTTTQTCDWYRPNCPYTKTFEQFILRELINSTVSDVSFKQAIIGQDTILAMIDYCIGVEVNWENLQNCREMDIDEISLKKGHQDFVTLISSRDKDNKINLIAILADRKKPQSKLF